MAISNSPHPHSDNSNGGDSRTLVGLLKLECSWKTARFITTLISSFVAPRTYIVHLWDWYLNKKSNENRSFKAPNWTKPEENQGYLLACLFAEPECNITIHNWNANFNIFKIFIQALHKTRINDWYNNFLKKEISITCTVVRVPILSNYNDNRIFRKRKL